MLPDIIKPVTKKYDLNPKKEIAFTEGLEHPLQKDYPCVMYDGSDESKHRCFIFSKAERLDSGHNCINLRVSGYGTVTVNIGQFLVKKNGDLIVED